MERLTRDEKEIINRIKADQKAMRDTILSWRESHIPMNAILRRAELEDKLESGELVELPKDKWCITRSGRNKKEYNYLVEHQVPYAEFWGNKWHIGMTPIKWREIIEKYDTKKQAEARLKELQEKGL